ncbi:unnamed protein product [Prorocentrum cordatum]|uniref:Uncharacterized protein n=1 Tax=Prorocentrum cordatum TaxID=2364126 RepID=A0ABN9TLM6_9DINO|nr:unnamed protein product [Polarella glacialis]
MLRWGAKAVGAFTIGTSSTLDSGTGDGTGARAFAGAPVAAEGAEGMGRTVGCALEQGAPSDPGDAAAAPFDGDKGDVESDGGAAQVPTAKNAPIASAIDKCKATASHFARL